MYFLGRYGILILAVISFLAGVMLNLFDYGLPIAFVLLVLVVIQNLVHFHNIENAIPVLVIGKPYIKRFGVNIYGTSEPEKPDYRQFATTTSYSSTVVSVHSATADFSGKSEFEYRGKAGEFDFVLIDVTNEPRDVSGGDTTARWVTAQGVFYTADGKVVAPTDNNKIFLRWWSEPEPVGGNLRVHRRVDIPHGNPVILGIAFKKVGEEITFAYDVGSHNQENLKKKGTALGRGKRIALITLGGDNVKNLAKWFSLEIKDNDTLEATEIIKPQWFKNK